MEKRVGRPPTHPKRCNDCDTPLTDENWSPSYEREHVFLCRPCAVARATAKQPAGSRKAYHARYYQEHRERILKTTRAWQREHPLKTRDTSRRYAKKHIDARNEKSRQKRVAIREKVLDAYGHACACCGEAHSEFLGIDHINGDGAQHRRESNLTRSGSAIYLWLLRRECPTDRFRLLCWNCNAARGFYGYCPHERERAAAV